MRDRIDEARSNGWSGEVEGLRTSLNATGAKLASLDRMIIRPQAATNHVTALGIPQIKPAAPECPPAKRARQGRRRVGEPVGGGGRAFAKTSISDRLFAIGSAQDPL